jgi:hypothetical protein
VSFDGSAADLGRRQEPRTPIAAYPDARVADFGLVEKDDVCCRGTEIIPSGWAQACDQRTNPT